jgi:hypothetical protein
VIIRSAFDIVDFEIDSNREPIFAWLCAERAAGVWRSASGLVGDLILDALAAMESRFSDSAQQAPLAYLESRRRAILDQLDPDSDFGPFHQFRMHAASSVAHALAASTVGADDEAVRHESTQAALAEISIVKGAFYRARNTYTGVYDHPSFIRQIEWQSDDLRVLSSDSGVATETLLSRSIERGRLLAQEIELDRLI